MLSYEIKEEVKALFTYKKQDRGTTFFSKTPFETEKKSKAGFCIKFLPILNGVNESDFGIVRVLTKLQIWYIIRI